MKRTLFGFLSLCLLCSQILFAESAHAKNGILLMPNLIVPKVGPRDSSSKLLYYGGPVISKVKIVTVFWNEQVPAIIKNEMPQFYADFVNSSQIDWLNEYKTNLKAIDGRDGTHQSFARGSHLGQKTLQVQQRSKNITDQDVRNEIEAQIRAGTLPKPDVDTLYMIHFPSDITISMEGMTSCRQFGGYHNAGDMKDLGQVFYAILPDCTSSSSAAESVLAQATFVGSHELIEAVTDPFPTPGDKPAYPQAWNSSEGEEISDLCPWFKGTFRGSKRSYSITKNWSNSRNTCFDGNL